MITSLLEFVVGPLGLVVGVVALAAVIGWQAGYELPAESRGQVLVRQATALWLPLLIVLSVILAARVVLLS
jgi:hypothetical protein